MKENKLIISYKEYDRIDELDPSDKLLLESAKNAIDSAYAPYSAYQVGAAVLLENGEILQGSNQENVAYPSGLCAERVAMFYASSKFPDVPVEAIAISAKAKDFVIDKPVTPCGSCRQVMAEAENRYYKTLKLIMNGETGKIYVMEGVNNILPLMFHADELKK